MQSIKRKKRIQNLNAQRENQISFQTHNSQQKAHNSSIDNETHNRAPYTSARGGWLDILRAQRATLNKKALGESVTTFALILIAIAAVILASYSVMSIVNLSDIQKSPEFQCLDRTFLLNDIDRDIRMTQACFNPETQQIEITVQRSEKDVQINSLSFILDQETWKCGESQTCSTCNVLASGVETYFVTPQENPEGKTLSFYIETCQLDELKIALC